MKFKSLFNEKYEDKELKNINKRYDGKAKISFIITGDAKLSLFHFLKILKQNGDIGHSFEYKIEDTGEKFYFDGDGEDRITDLTIENVE